jgi:hypothetical protein
MTSSVDYQTIRVNWVNEVTQLILSAVMALPARRSVVYIDAANGNLVGD